LFNPEEKMPEVFKNRIAFIVWTVWRSSHLLVEGEERILRKAALSVGNFLLQFQPPYSIDVKRKAVEIFAATYRNSNLNHSIKYAILKEPNLSSFWNEIFLYLEGVREFKWELTNK
jgi:hypothetical protein